MFLRYVYCQSLMYVVRGDRCYSWRYSLALPLLQRWSVINDHLLSLYL